MPIADHIPVIDDRSYDDIIAEIRTRIARYTPEWQPVWSDVNDNDPGITMMQVFAWLSEILIYRLGKVPEHNYLKFLQLLGIELNPAEPAIAEIWFPVKASYTEAFVIVPARTQVSAQSDNSSRPIIFETDQALTALTAVLDKVQAYDGFSYRDVSSDNDEAVSGYEPFGPLANADSALLLGFDYSAAMPEIEFDLAVSVVDVNASNTDVSCSLPQTTVYASAELVWEYWQGSDWVEMSIRKDDSNAMVQSGHVKIKFPASEKMQQLVIGQVSESRFWIRSRLVSAAYEKAPRLLAVRTNTMRATQAETIKDEVLGGSSGQPNQLLNLANKPVLANSLSLEIDEGDDFKTWQIVEDFYASTADDSHYVLNRTTGQVTFGDGVHGRIPVANVNNAGANIVAREYRIGGGKLGNVAAASLTSLLTGATGVDENAIGNLLAAHSGRDEEALEDAKLRAPRALKSQCRAVSVEDFETLAKAAANVKRAQALPLYHPDFPEVKVPGVISVIVVPDSDAEKPMPSEGMLKTVCEYLNQRRLLTTEVYILKPQYQKISIDVDVVVENSADLAEVQETIETDLIDYFHPLHGGESGSGWPFGGAIYFSLVYRRILNVAGVARLTELKLLLDDVEQVECKDIDIASNTLLYSVNHQITGNYGSAKL